MLPSNKRDQRKQQDQLEETSILRYNNAITSTVNIRTEDTMTKTG